MKQMPCLSLLLFIYYPLSLLPVLFVIIEIKSYQLVMIFVGNLMPLSECSSVIDFLVVQSLELQVRVLGKHICIAVIIFQTCFGSTQ